MAQTIKVNIIGDSSAFERSLSRAASGTKAFAKHAGLATLAVGGFAAYLGTKAVRAAIDEQKEMTKLTAAFKAQGLQMDASSKQVQALEEAGKKLGFTDDDTRVGLTKLIQAGRSYAQATKQLAVAQDLARSSGQSLGDATTGLIRLQAGNVRVAKQYGIVLPDLTAKQWKAKAAADGLTLAQEKGKFAYDALTQKISGQADAFTHTAAGAAATFQANLQDLEEEIGTKLLPALTSVISTVNAHWPQISATIDAAVQGIGYAINNIAKPAIEALISAGRVAVAWFQANWPQISQKTMAVFNTVKAVVMTTVAVIRALWAQFGSTIVAQTKATWEAIRATVQNVLNVIRGIVNIIGGLMHGDWSRVWKGIQQVFGGITQQILAMARFWASALRNLVQAAFSAMVAVIRAAVGQALAAATAVGQAIVNGIERGLKRVYAAVKGGLDKIWSAITNVAEHALGAAIAIGTNIVVGIIRGLSGLAGKVAGAIKSGLSSGIHAVGGVFHGSGEFMWTKYVIGEPMAQGVAEGFASGMAARGAEFVAPLRAIALKIAAQIPDMRKTLMAQFRGLATDMLSAFDQAVANWTPPSQKILDKMQREDTINQAVKQVADAQAAVDAAQAKLTADLAAGPAEGESAADFQTRIEQDKAAIASAVQQLGEAQRSYTETQLQLAAAQEEAAHQKAMAAKRQQLTEQLLLLQNELAKHPEQWRAIQNKILKLLKGYVPGFNTAGYKIAHAFEEGLAAGFEEVIKAARKLANALEQIGGSGGGGGATTPATGSGVGQGAGRGTTVNVHVHGNVMTENDLVNAVYDGLLRKGRNNAGLGFT